MSDENEVPVKIGSHVVEIPEQTLIKYQAGKFAKNLCLGRFTCLMLSNQFLDNFYILTPSPSVISLKHGYFVKITLA